ncbi:hypothetical protein HAX54_018246 [Datura stramonium]|uniref:SCP domain-containing protein n=1 Tax=Datura stramonium TaxID=4076 RepID=A0ABS8S144_DATST|nr:hypothetical protein [Datura stramonium]
MELFKSTLLLVCLMILAIFHSCEAQNSPQDYLAVHNDARGQVGVGPMSWDPALATKAQNYANSRTGDCNLIHSGPGENLAKGSGDFTGRRAVQLWVAEKPDYNYATNQCASGKQYAKRIPLFLIIGIWTSGRLLNCALRTQPLVHFPPFHSLI